MSFISPEFAILAVCFFWLYWALVAHPTWQFGLLLLSSYGLYATWSVAFAGFLAFYSGLLWALGYYLARRPQRSDMLLKLGLLAIIGFLVTFKYYGYFLELLQPVLRQLGFFSMLPVADWAAPVGVSFFTFQAITYAVSVYRQQLPAQSLPRVMLYLCFWPTLFAGPIFRAQHFFAQLDDTQNFGRPRQGSLAIYLLLLGIAQKLVLASWLASQFVDPVFKSPDLHGGLAVLCAMIAYTLQIFFDFAGYTAVVTGMALLLGFELPVNFKQPYLARDIQIFWQRWHISLSSFIRDYIYIPLGGNRHGFVRTQTHLIIAMLCSGLWHGAGNAFVLWGLLHGLAVVVLNLRKRWNARPLPAPLAHAITLVFISVTWVFFRSASAGGSVQDALHLLALLGAGGLASWHPSAAQVFPLMGLVLLCPALGLFSLRAQAWQEAVCQRLDAAPLWAVIASITAVFSVCLWLGPSGVPSFIYYQF